MVFTGEFQHQIATERKTNWKDSLQSVSFNQFIDDRSQVATHAAVVQR